MAHDFKRFPELTNNQMQSYYFDSPHKQITEDFTARVVKVHDGDTVSVHWSGRDFDFPIRLAALAAPELNEAGGHEAQKWLKDRIEGKNVDIRLTPQRVEKWGRLLAHVYESGINVAEEEIQNGLAMSWDKFQRIKEEEW